MCTSNTIILQAYIWYTDEEAIQKSSTTEKHRKRTIKKPFKWVLYGLQSLRKISNIKFIKYEKYWKIK